MHTLTPVHNETRTSDTATGETPTATSYTISPIGRRLLGLESRSHQAEIERSTDRRRVLNYTLPVRFDVHQIDRVGAELDELSHHHAVEVDGSQVEMIDLSALETLGRLAADRPSLRIVQPSVALRATADYTGHRRVSAAFSLAPLAGAA